MFKQNSDFFAIHVQKDIIPSISALNVRNDLKEADIIPVYKKRSRLFKEDYRPISTLPNIFKVYEKCLCDQIWKYFETRFSKFQCIFRKCYSTHYCLPAMNEKWTILYYIQIFGCIPNDLIIAKLAAHGFDNNSLKLIHNYLCKGWRLIVLTAYENIFFMVFRKVSYLLKIIIFVDHFLKKKKIDTLYEDIYKEFSSVHALTLIFIKKSSFSKWVASVFKPLAIIIFSYVAETYKCPYWVHRDVNCVMRSNM